MKTGLLIIIFLLPFWVCGQRISISIKPAHTQAQVLPEYPGGIKAMMAYMESTDYPDAAISKGQEGLVVIGFTVTETGEVGAIRILQSSGHHLLDSTAVHEVNDMPDWTPGFKYGTAVPVLMTIAVKYSLDNVVLDGKNW